jgi:hypothetical protein
MKSVSLKTNSSLRFVYRFLPSSFSSSLASSAAASPPAPAAAPPAAGAAAALPPDPTFSSRSLTSLPSSALSSGQPFPPYLSDFIGSIPLRIALSRSARPLSHWQPLLGSEVYRPSLIVSGMPTSCHNWGLAVISTPSSARMRAA